MQFSFIVISLVFTLIMMFASRWEIGVVAAVLGMVTWISSGMYWTITNTEIIAVYYLFYGFALVCLIFLIYGVFQVFKQDEDREGILG